MKNVEVTVTEPQALGGGIEGAEQTTRETLSWLPDTGSPDVVIGRVKDLADARSIDVYRNDGYTNGANNTYKDSIVGHQYRLNAKPDWKTLGVSEAWADEFQEIVESRFNTISESSDNWFDASRICSFTNLIRLSIGSYFLTGESVAVAEWLNRDITRPFASAIQEVASERLTNAYGQADSDTLRRGVEINKFGQPMRYHFRKAHPGDDFTTENYTWKVVPARKPWGRKQVHHIFDRLQPEQNRGLSQLVSVLKDMKMTKTFKDVTLQNAVVNASYAAAIESELPSSDVFMTLGAGLNDPMSAMSKYIQSYLGGLGQYVESGKNIAIDGAKIPHLFPGTKLNMKPMGTPGGVGTDFEASLVRHIAANLGLSYEQFSKDYSKTNFASAQSAANETAKMMIAKKRLVADSRANFIYELWLEEEVARGNIPLPPGKDRSWFYQPYVKEALCRANWIGASRGSIDELKAVNSASLRMENNLSTLEEECARNGHDYRDIIRQKAREKAMLERYGLNMSDKTNVSEEENQNDDQQ